MFHQGDRLLAGWAGMGSPGVVAAEQEHQRCSQLFSASAGPLGLEGMPVSIADGQQPLQGHGLLQGALWPAALRLCQGLGHWTFA